MRSKYFDRTVTMGHKMKHKKVKKHTNVQTIDSTLYFLSLPLFHFIYPNFNFYILRGSPKG